MHRYAWLELEEGVWHFLTHLDADPAESKRRWTDGKRALTELMDEGWAVVRAYPHHPVSGGPGLIVHGYGLTRTVH